jgi:hypothetical protein
MIENNELSRCVSIYTDWKYEFDAGEDIESYCSGKAKDRINEYIDIIVEICEIRIS